MFGTKKKQNEKKDNSSAGEVLCYKDGVEVPVSIVDKAVCNFWGVQERPGFLACPPQITMELLENNNDHERIFETINWMSPIKILFAYFKQYSVPKKRFEVNLEDTIGIMHILLKRAKGENYTTLFDFHRNVEHFYGDHFSLYKYLKEEGYTFTINSF